MQTVVSAEEMRWCDDTAMREYGIPGVLLMENAGRSVAEEAERMFGSLAGEIVLIFSGKGNNGGDGFVAARHLANKGAKVHVVLLAAPRELKGDARTNFEILKRIQKRNARSLSIRQFSASHLGRIPRPRLIIDAIFGTGFSGSLRKPISDAVRWINQSGVTVLAVDVPSGVNGTSGEVEDSAVRASRTVTFALMKSGLLCNQGRDHSGGVTVSDIGVPASVSIDPKLRTKLVEAPDVTKALPARPSTAHKYSVGKVFVLAGSKGFTGAAALCATAALRSGAGAVVLGAPESVYNVLARKLNEVIVVPFPSTQEGTLSRAGCEKILERMTWADAVIIGPGLSQQQETQEAIVELLKRFRGNVVLDADGLNALSKQGHKVFKQLRGQFILTPHTGEMSRLVGRSSGEIERTRIEVARSAARTMRATIVLKGAPTATADENGIVYLNPTGNPGMATLGAGDVLGGMMASLWAQGMEKVAAAYTAVYIHGFSGDLAQAQFGERSIVAQDLIDFIPEALLSLESKIIH